MTASMTDRPDLEAALSRAGNDANLRVAAGYLSEVLHVDELILEAASTKANGFDGAAFVTNRRVLVQTGAPNNQMGAPHSATFEALDIDAITNVFTRHDGPTWALIAEAFNAYKVWGGFAQRAAQRLEFAAQWALTTGREVRVRAERPQDPMGIFEHWRKNKAHIYAVPDEHKVQELKKLLKNGDNRWWIQ